MRELAILEEAAATLRTLDIPRPPHEPLSTPMPTRRKGADAAARNAHAASNGQSPSLRLALGGARGSSPLAAVGKALSRAGSPRAAQPQPRAYPRLVLVGAALVGGAVALAAGFALQVELLSYGI